MIAEPSIDVQDGTWVDVRPVHRIETTSESKMFYILRGDVHSERIDS